MKELFVFGVFVIVLISAGLHVHGEEEISCENVQDGLYIKGCREFYRCDNETYRHLPCPLDLVVNERIMVCDYPEKVQPPCGKARNCTGIEDGRYPILDKRCRYYYTCHRGEYYGETRCQPGLVYNIMKDSCDWPYLTEKPCGTVGNVKDSKPKSIPPRWEQRTKSPPTVPIWKPTDWPPIPETAPEPTRHVKVRPEGF